MHPYEDVGQTSMPQINQHHEILLEAFSSVQTCSETISIHTREKFKYQRGTAGVQFDADRTSSRAAIALIGIDTSTVVPGCALRKCSSPPSSFTR